jgi:hypothetical protein
MAQSTAEARAEILDTLAQATELVGMALAALAAAYEQVDEQTADRLEEELFGPVQHAYGTAKRTHEQFAARHDLPSNEFHPPNAGLPSTGARGFIDAAIDAGAQADQTLADLQDSMLPVEVGDQELRAGLTEVRELLDGLRRRGRELERTLGR